MSTERRRWGRGAAGPPDLATQTIEPEIAFHVRQGDVLLRRVAGPPPGGVPVDRDGGRIVLAYGEVTGHAHAIRSADATLVAAGGRRFLSAAAPVVIEHEEHTPIALPEGTYEVVIQREYAPTPATPATRPAAGWRRVAD
jgi:hypothetical protein